MRSCDAVSFVAMHGTYRGCSNEVPYIAYIYTCVCVCV